MEDSTPTVKLRPERVAALLSVITILIVIMSILGQAIKYNYINFYMGGAWKDWKEAALDLLSQTFFMDWEANVPTYFNTMLLAVPAALFAAIAVWKKQIGDKFKNQWAGLAWIFLYLSIDEAAVIHEKLIKPVRGMFNYEGYGGLLYFAWVIPGIAVVILFALAYLRFFLHLDNRSKIFFAAALVVYVSGIIGGEMLSGHFAETIGQKNFTYAAYTSLEESLEYFGMILMIYWLLDYIKRFLPSGIALKVE
ncbi:MAG: hypothetical protein Fur002_22660 [Anaerolineales bacterium]